MKASTRIWSACNGEVYNHVELRHRLEASGTSFLSETDCEVIPHLYAERGAEFVADLEGIFAGAIVDAESRTLLLYRDRFGARPLYYATGASWFAFCSEIKGLLALPMVRADVDPQALEEYLAFQMPLDDRTLFAGIRQIPAGTAITVHDDGGLRRLDLEPLEPTYSFASLEDAGDALRLTLDSAIRRQLYEPIGVNLSGGMDSGAIVATSAQHAALHTFAASFVPQPTDPDDAGADETAYAAALAAHCHTTHHEVLISASDFRNEFNRLIWHVEDLRMPMAFGGWRLSEFASKHVRVVFSGMGGDELFAGYVARYQQLLATEKRGWTDAYAGAWARRMTSVTDRSRALRTPVEPAIEVLRAQLDIGGRYSRESPLRQILNFEQRTFLQGLLLVEDRTSMAHGVEVRVPFIDSEVASLAASLPDEFLVSFEMDRGKLALREAMRPLLPEGWTTRPKQGFRVPESSWYRSDLRPWITETLVDVGNAGIGDVVSPSFIRQAAEDFLNGRSQRRHLVWSLLCLEAWFRLFVMRD